MARVQVETCLKARERERERPNELAYILFTQQFKEVHNGRGPSTNSCPDVDSDQKEMEDSGGIEAYTQHRQQSKEKERET